jgi:hypothetical protein
MVLLTDSVAAMGPGGRRHAMRGDNEEEPAVLSERAARPLVLLAEFRQAGLPGESLFVQPPAYPGAARGDPEIRESLWRSRRTTLFC